MGITYFAADELTDIVIDLSVYEAYQDEGEAELTSVFLKGIKKTIMAKVFKPGETISGAALKGFASSLLDVLVDLMYDMADNDNRSIWDHAKVFAIKKAKDLIVDKAVDYMLQNS